MNYEVCIHNLSHCSQMAQNKINHTATAVVLKYRIITKRLPNSVSVDTAELYAILLALSELSKQQHKHYLLIF